ncbi:MAG: DNA-binding transcriptional regulator, CsgD family [Blastococcus sp.]|nr:DNA-binding transcriptional regulator, CsgD family [Blastococcus sp.]
MSSEPGANGRPPNTAEILREVTGIAAEPGALAERAEALLAQVERVVPFEASFIAVLRPGEGAHVAMGRHGYGDRVEGYMDGTSMLEDIELLGLTRSRRLMQNSDSPVPMAEIPGWAEYLEPAGFRDSFAVGLFTPDGRYLGVLGMHTASEPPVNEANLGLIELIAPQVAVAVDPLCSLATIAGLVQRAAAGIVLAPSGAVLSLPGLPQHRLLTPGSGVLAAAAAQLAGDGPYASFVAPLPDAEGAEGGETHVRVTVLAAPSDLRAFAAAVVLLSPAPDLHGLSRRELQVLGWLVTGASNERIALGLSITARTVEVHVGHLLAKLAASSRTAAAARALRLGLFVPSSLLGVPS